MAEETREKPSVRNLVDSDYGTPLRKFTGVLDKMPTEPATGYLGTRVNLNFREVEVLQAIEPYNFPIATINLGLSNRKKSKWGVISISFTDIVDQQYTETQKDPSSPEFIPAKDRQDWKDFFGKRLGFVVADGEDGRPPKHDLFDGRAKDEAHPKGQDVPTAVWVVYSVEGVGVAGGEGITPTDKAMQLLDGKTLSEFNKAAMADELVRSDTDLLTAIGKPVSAKDSFANVMIASKKFTKDTKTGTYQRVEEEIPF